MAESVQAEIRSLRKGRGIYVVALDQQRLPYLYELAADGNGSVPDVHNLVREISAYSAALPEDLRTAITASLGLSADTRRMPLFKDRMGWLSAQLRCSYRVALRRVDLAERLLAEEITRELLRRRGRTASAPCGWYLEEFRTVLRLETPSPEAHEHRRVVATVDDLREVMASLDVPRDADQPRPDLAAEVLYGGQIVRRERPTGSRYQYMVQMPKPLHAGEAHEYGLLLRVPSHESMRPHYVFTPELRCDRFELRVRFPTGRRPRWVRRVEGETVRTFDAARHDNDLLPLDGAGELRVQFHNLAMYLGYGVQWAW